MELLCFNNPRPAGQTTSWAVFLSCFAINATWRLWALPPTNAHARHARGNHCGSSSRVFYSQESKCMFSLLVRATRLSSEAFWSLVLQRPKTIPFLFHLLLRATIVQNLALFWNDVLTVPRQYIIAVTTSSTWLRGILFTLGRVSSNKMHNQW